MSIFSKSSFRLNAFVIGLVALSAICIAAVDGMLSTLSFESHMRQVTFPALLNTVTNMVDRELIAPVSTLETLAKNPFFTGWVASGGDEAQAAQVFAMGRELMRTHNTSGMNVVLRDSLRYFQFDDQTATVFTTSKERDSWFFDFEAGKNELGINIHAADDPLYPGMIFFNQRIDLNGKFAGIISTSMKLESVLGKLAGMAIGKHGTIMLVRANGTLLIHTSKGYIDKHLQELPGYENAAANILAGRTAEFEYVNAAGRRTLVLAKQIPTLNLVLVSEADLDEQLADVQTTKWYAMGSGLLFILLGGIAGILLIMVCHGQRTAVHPPRRHCGNPAHPHSYRAVVHHHARRRSTRSQHNIRHNS